jgi:hypothetical protein
MLHRVRQPRPIELPIAQQHHGRPRRDQPADPLDQGEREGFGNVPLRGLAHPPRQREGATFRDDMDPQGGAPAAHAAALHDAHQRRQGHMTKQDVRLG